MEAHVPFSHGLGHVAGYESLGDKRGPGCEMRLVRNPDASIAELRDWRPAEDEPRPAS